MTLDEMITATRFYLDDDSESRIFDNEITYYINLAYDYYYNDCINKSYQRFLTTTELSLTDGKVALPSDFYKAQIVYFLDSGSYTPVEHYINYTDSVSTDNSYGDVTYDFEGNYITFNGVNTGTIKLVYYPEMTELSLSTDEPITGFLKNWHKLIPLHAAIIAKGGREEEDLQGLLNLKAIFEQPYNDYLTRMTNSRSYVQPFYF